MNAQMLDVVADLRAEHDRLDARLRQLSSHEWDLPSAAPGWAVRDCVSHVAQFDDDAQIALRNPEVFTARAVRAATDPSGYLAAGLDHGRSLPPHAVLAWWRERRGALADELERCDPRQRVPWFGPSMSARSCATARLMETWAHGLDVFDVTGGSSPQGDQLRHIAMLGCLTRQHSYSVRGRQVPTEDVRAELELPSGAPWAYGPGEAGARVRGSAVDFCAVVTQRRHVDDTSLAVEGAVAIEWMSIAQAFAGAATARPAPRGVAQP